MKTVFVIKENYLQPYKDGNITITNYIVTRKTMTNVIVGAKKFETREDAEAYIQRNLSGKVTERRSFEVFKWEK